MNTTISTTSRLNRHDDHIFEATWLRALVVAFLALVIVLTACGNGLVLWALKRFVSLRQPGHVYLGGLAFADLCMIVPLLLKITQILTRSTAVCVTQGITELVIVCCISLHLGCISVERFVSIKFALRYASLVTNQRVYASIIILWLVSLSAAFLIPLAIDPGQFEDLADGVISLCSPNTKRRISRTQQSVLAYAIFMFWFFFCLPCFTIVVSYTYIFIASFRQRQKMAKVISHDETRCHSLGRRLRKEFKAARTVFVLQSLFILTYFPYFSVSVARLEKHEAKERPLFYVSKLFSLLAALTCCLNPIIYVSGNEQFKTAFKKLFGKHLNVSESITA